MDVVLLSPLFLMFALLALGGDVGCSSGPALVGFAAGLLNDDLKMGILAGSIFPVLLLVGIFICRKVSIAGKIHV